MDKLIKLIKDNTDVREDGFSLALYANHEEFDILFKRVGMSRIYDEIASILNSLYKEKYGHDYILSDRCLSFEIKFHADAYMRSIGYHGYSLNPLTLPFSKGSLIRHCKVIDISMDDVKNLKQRIVFGYKRGIRKCYKGTDFDPFKKK